MEAHRESESTESEQLSTGLSNPPSAFPLEEFSRIREQASEAGHAGQNESGLNDNNITPPLVTEPSFSDSTINNHPQTPLSKAEEAGAGADSLPPNYEDSNPYQNRTSLDLPAYAETTPSQQRSLTEKTSTAPSSLVSDEKKRMDLEAVTDAVEHTYQAVPQLVDQRAELRDTAAGLGKGKEPQRKMSVQDEKELNKIFDQIERAHGHKLPAQSMEIDSDKAKERETRKRESFYNDLAVSSSAGRLHDQEYDLSRATPRSSPLARTFAQAGVPVGSEASEQMDEWEQPKKAREIVTMVQAIRDGPGQI